MFITFNPLDQHLFAITVNNMPYSLEEVVDDLKNQDWEYHTAYDGLFDIEYCHPGTVKSHRLQEIQDFLFGSEFKTQWISQLTDNAIFRTQHPDMDLSRLHDNTDVGFDWARTPPNQNKAPLHNDDIRILSFGLIYLVQSDDPDQSTYFVKFDGSGETRVPTGFGRGWVVVNTEKSDHRAFNNTDNYRYHLRFSLRPKS
jgi:hypothetical protein